MGKKSKDIEKGDAHDESLRNHVDEYEGLDEYAALQKFITTYRDPKAAEAEGAEEGDVTAAKKPWWAFWRSSKGSGAADSGVVPPAWLEADINQGITESDVQSRRKRFGWNEIVTEKENLFLKFLGFFRGPVLYSKLPQPYSLARSWVRSWHVTPLTTVAAMELAVLLAAGLRDWVDFGVIIGILLLNAIVGWYQEKQAADVVASLKGDIAMRATVVRDGREQNILAREIVPGDIIVLEEGQTVPADVRLICDYSSPQDFERYKELRDSDKFKEDDPEDEADEAEDEQDKTHRFGQPLVACDQSAITGESLAVDKFMGDVCYYTTGCKRGKAYGVALTSAKFSFVGRTATLVAGAKDSGHFKAIMDSIGTSLLVLVVFFILVSWIDCDSRGQLHQLAALRPLILLIVGVPVGLPVVTTTTLAVGAAYLAEEKAIVQKLTAIESRCRSLCASPTLPSGQDVNWMMACAALASSHNIKSLDPIVKVTILSLKRYPKAREILQQPWRTEKFTPFDPVSKRITTVCWLNGDKYVCAKGAPKAIVNLSNCSKEVADLYRDKATEFARRGFRSLGHCQTILEAQNLGVPVKMLTGDAIASAKETCKMLALGTKVYNSEMLIHGGLTGSTQHDLSSPSNKYQVVEMLQQRGHLTAMTGDGVNDAPSLKKADCGIAVEGSTEAAQAAADIVFLAPAHRLHCLFADLATVAVAYDNAFSDERPVEWQLPKIWIISVILGILLAAGTWIIRGSMFLSNGGIVQNFGSVQEILFLEVSLTENWLIFVTRGGKTWPSWLLVGAIFGVDALATIFCIFGCSRQAPNHQPSTPSTSASMAGLTSSPSSSSGVTRSVSPSSSPLSTSSSNRIPWLDNLGRKDRGNKNERLENIIGRISKLAIEHSVTVDGKNSYSVVEKKADDDEE
ncbi:E1-E2 ATPase-domain-containing protein [Phyllosticta citriasiana]|uniref:E1-E2 ATPase-domain-containing protein n=1 Tax=Phyllosticta citriasiana TaxID=595635 RepID=UPI0030FD7DF7